MVKRRVQPEDVIINCSKDSVWPVPPEGHKWKEVRHDNTVSIEVFDVVVIYTVLQCSFSNSCAVLQSLGHLARILDREYSEPDQVRHAEPFF